MSEPTDRNCGDCGVTPGTLHSPGCDVERCPRCGGQSISCGCIYEVCGIDRFDLEKTRPDVYRHGPTAEMYARWDAEWGDRRLPWTGEWPGVAECREFGWYCKFIPDRGWTRCDEDDPEATGDLNRLYRGEARWDASRGRFILVGRRNDERTPGHSER